MNTICQTMNNMFFPCICTSFKVTLSAAQLKTANSIAIDIPQLSAPGKGYAWSIVMAELRFFAGSTAFTSTTLFLITDTAAVEQMVSGVILNSGCRFFQQISFHRQFRFGYS